MERWNSIRDWYEHIRAECLDRCTSCGLCVDVCPLFAMADWDGLTGAKMQDERLAVLRDGVVGDAVHRFTFACNNCAVCKGSCPEQLDIFELTHVMRWAMGEAGRPAPDNLGAPPPSASDSFLRASAAIQTKPSEVRWLDTVADNPPRADTVIFIGCTIVAQPDKVNTLLDTLALLDLSIPVVSGPELCCGSIEELRGDIATFEQLLGALVTTLARYQPKKVVYLCSGCYGKVLQIAPRFMDVPFQSQHLSGFLCEHIDRLSLARVEKTATVHDSCGLGRIIGQYDPVRQLLGAIPGLKLVEMAKNRDESICCAVMTMATMPELACTLQRQTMDQATSAGASTLATVCHGCQRRFGGYEKDYPVRVENYISLVGEALGIHYEDRLKRYTSYHDPERVIAETAEYIDASKYPRHELEELVRRYFP